MKDEKFKTIVVVGAGKTGMDAALFLLDQAVDPRQIRWIIPNDAWLLDRDQIQPGRTLDFFVAPFQPILASHTTDEVFHSLESDQRLLRLDSDIWPTKYRCATVDRRELQRACFAGRVCRKTGVKRPALWISVTW